MTDPALVIAIPTWRRVGVLQDLLCDLSRQDLVPKAIVIVDADWQSNQVVEMLRTHPVCKRMPTYLAPSTRPNLPFQRYIGWHVARKLGASVVGYLDDDLRLVGNRILGDLLGPFLVTDLQPGAVVGVTAEIQMETAESRSLDRFAARLGSANLEVTTLPNKPAGITSSGHRCSLPRRAEGEFSFVTWFRGGVLMIRERALNDDLFSRDLMNSYERKLGKGEDTVMGLRVSSRGCIVHLHTKRIRHPGKESPRAYPAAAFQRGRATAYSRRLINDNLRYPDRSQARDKLGLLRSYLGAPVVHFARGLVAADLGTLQYAAGFAVGAIEGILAPPHRYRPAHPVDWNREAGVAARGCNRMVPGSRQSSPLPGVALQPAEHGLAEASDSEAG
jgi:GT2 family glycosyltransferase